MDLKRQASEIISKQVRRLGAFPTFNGMINIYKIH